MSVNVEQTLSFTTQDGVIVWLKKTDNDVTTQLTLQDKNDVGELFHIYLNRDEIKALLSILEKVYNPYKNHY
jgi:hypothetical protein